MGLGAPELILIFIVFAFYLVFPIWGYRAGSKRTVGGAIGLLLGFFANIIGIIIIYLFPRIDEQKYYFQNTSSTADELQKYKQLLDSGAITEEEYQVQKKKILG